MLRFWVLHFSYRIRWIGEENLPAAGGLLVSNHVSFVDPLILWSAFRRPIRVLISNEIYQKPLLRPFLRLMRVIPVPVDTRGIVRALRKARQEIRKGSLVCIFAEGELTRTGHLLPFNRGFEFIMKTLEVPILPLHLDGVWGSIFSFEGGRYFWKLPRTRLRAVTISVGKPMPARSKAHQVKCAVQELAAHAFVLKSKTRRKLHVAFTAIAKRYPFRFAMADSLGSKFSYSQVLAAILLLRHKLFSKDLRAETPEEKIGILLPTSCLAAILTGAVLYAGKIPVHLNFTVPRESVESAAQQCGMKTILSSHTFLEKIKFAPLPGMVMLEDIQKGIKTSERIIFWLRALFLPVKVLLSRYAVNPGGSVDEIATIIFSSGSTGRPKGVMLSHANFYSNLEGVLQVLHVRSSDILMGILPFFHSFGFMATLCMPLGTGAGVVYHSNPLDAETVGKLVHRYKATLIMGAPTFFTHYIKRVPAEEFRTLRYAVTGAEKLKLNIAKAFIEKFHVTLFEGYGITELSPVVSMGLPDFVDETKGIRQVSYKEGKVGHPIPGVAVKVVDPDTFAERPLGESGVLLVKGPNVMKGYLNNPEATREVIRDGWYVTGDIASLDRDGFITITDRLSRFSKIGGEMVPHVKIEEKIQELLGATEPACVVAGVPDEERGERLVVLYKGHVEIADLWKKLNTAGLPKLWVPKRENFYQVSEIPLLGSGKLDLKKIKAVAFEKTGAIPRFVPVRSAGPSKL